MARERRPRWRPVLLALLLLFLLLFLVAWLQRRTIAADYINRELARRGVQARYDITSLGFGKQRLENVVIGDPARPDLTARIVEVQFSYGFRAPRLRWVGARGVRLFARVGPDGKLSVGEIDKLLPPPTGAPFTLPDLIVDLADTAVRLDTPAGRFGIALKGAGNLSDGFLGRAAVASRQAALGSCSATSVAALLEVGVRARRPRLAGPVRSSRVDCGEDVSVTDPLVTVDATLAPALDGWIGNSRLTSGPAHVTASRFGGLQGGLSFAGDRHATRGAIDVAASELRSGDLAGKRIAFKGSYEQASATGLVSLSGDVEGRRLSVGRETLLPVLNAFASTDGTPLAPLGRSLAQSVERAGRLLDIQAHVAFAERNGRGAIRVTSGVARSGSGAQLSLGGAEGITYGLPEGEVVIGGDVSLGGGGLPSVQATLAQAGAGSPIRGTARIAPFAAGGARLALKEVHFSAGGGGTTRIDTVATLDGPFSGGRVDGLVLPIHGRFDSRSFAIGEGCTATAFRALRYTSLRLGPTRLSLCPTERALVWGSGGSVRGGFRIPRPRLAGRLGSTPITLTADRFRLGFDGPNFSGDGVAVALGSSASLNRLNLARLSGRFTPNGVAGTFTGGDGKIANVPLLMSNGQGRWSVARGTTTVDARMTVADDNALPRFYPLATDDFHLTLVGNRIDASGWLHDPETGTRVTRATLVHALDTGRGNARLDIEGIRFDEKYQPEELTRLTTGVVALVRGSVKGVGEISWSPEGTASSGTFSTDDMSFAAAFGPVSGLSTTLHFTDLLGLVTAPGQLAQVAQIQTGIDVFEGRIRYQLLPDLRVRVESGRWPFAGGELVLEETILDFSKPSAKFLTFRVIGMDAAAFVQQMEFSNISATGSFDGIIPMVFDEKGGRIVAGHLEARSGGGVVSYIGELTDQQLGAYGKLAFDALKALRYSKLIIDLDGALDGEFVAGVELDGIARDPTVTTTGGGIRGMVASRALSQLAKIPFEFNIKVRAPFRAMIGTMRSLEDPTQLIQSALPPELRDQPTNVQPQESESVR